MLLRPFVMPALLALSVYGPAAAADHARPVVAVIGHPAGTELTDFVVPYAVLQRSDAVTTVSVSTMPGPMTMRPAALRLQPDVDVTGFDTRYPEGADFVIVPAIVQGKDPTLLAWLRDQQAKGATLVSICDGALVLANAGLLDGHKATAHWATESHRRTTYPRTTWVSNTRYVIDGRVMSSAGISASIPASLALLESIAGHDKAAQVGATFGVSDWSATHRSDAFGIRWGTLGPLVRVNATNKWFHSVEHLGIPMQDGMDDVAFALTADAYSRTGRSVAYGIAVAPVRSRAGLQWLPDTAHVGGTGRLDVVEAQPGAPLFDGVLASIARRYGRSTARGVAMDFEYPWTPAKR
jgi:putative intracellular protease/amidase